MIVIVIFLFSTFSSAVAMDVNNLLSIDPYSLPSTQRYSVLDDLVASSENTQPINAGSRKFEYPNTATRIKSGELLLKNAYQRLGPYQHDIRTEVGRSLFNSDKRSVSFLHSPEDLKLKRHSDKAYRLDKINFGSWIETIDKKYPRRYNDVVPEFQVDLDVIRDGYAKKTAQPLTTTADSTGYGRLGGVYKTSFRLNDEYHHHIKAIDRRSDIGSKSMPTPDTRRRSHRRRRKRIDLPRFDRTKSHNKGSESSKYFSDWTYWDDLPQKMKQLRKYSQMKKLKEELNNRNARGVLKHYNWRWSDDSSRKHWRRSKGKKFKTKRRRQRKSSHRFNMPSAVIKCC